MAVPWRPARPVRPLLCRKDSTSCSAITLRFRSPGKVKNAVQFVTLGLRGRVWIFLLITSVLSLLQIQFKKTQSSKYLQKGVFQKSLSKRSVTELVRFAREGARSAQRGQRWGCRGHGRRHRWQLAPASCRHGIAAGCARERPVQCHRAAPTWR